MSLGAGELAKLLGGTRGVDEFVACERETVRVRRDLGVRGGVMRVEERALHADLYRDLSSGRGEVRESFTGLSLASARAQARDAAARAAALAGPAWRLPAPAAPARVKVADASIIAAPERAIETVVAELAAALPRGARLVRGTITAEVERTWVHASGGFASHFDATRLRWRAAIAVGDRPAVIAEGATRRVEDVELGAELAAAAERSAPAEPLAAGRYDLVVTLRALAPAHPTFAWLAPMVAQADGRRSRLGLSRYRPSQRVFAGATGDALSVTSDGTLPFALLSAPFGDRGEPVRRFPLIESGRAVGIALDLREAGLRDTAANGGVRNLVVEPGAAPAASLHEPGDRPLVVTDDLAWMKVDPGGLILAGLGSSRVVGADRRHGGLVTEDAFALWARARLAAETGRRGWYQGPIAVRFDDVVIS